MARRIMAIGSKICKILICPFIFWKDAYLHRYEVNPKLGTSDDLKSLADALHKRGMYLMVDVVPNHMVRNSLY